MTKGILVGCDQKQEWMLTWWWEHYSKHNRYPVAFVDFGMSEKAKAWCRAKGELISLSCPKTFVQPKEAIAKETIIEWEKRYGSDLWSVRESWFRKPFALLQTPFQETIWTDLDCEIVSSLAPLFRKIHSHSGLAIARERNYASDDAGYNSGVIAYRKASPMISRWAEECLYKNDRFLGDQDVLSFLIQSEHIEIAELPDNYNWRMKFGVNFEAVIIHWVGLWGKEIIRRSIY